MILGICIVSIPLVLRAVRYHHSQLSSIAHSLSSRFQFIGRTFTARSATDYKSTGVYEMDRDSESNNGLVELGKPMQPRGERGMLQV